MVRYHDVRRLDVTMHQPQRVELPQTFQSLSCDEACEVHRLNDVHPLRRSHFLVQHGFNVVAIDLCQYLLEAGVVFSDRIVIDEVFEFFDVVCTFEFLSHAFEVVFLQDLFLIKLFDSLKPV